METKFVELSLVILANDHNPTILNPDFLKLNKIVKDEWEWNVIGQSITTPAFSTVSYDSGSVITVEPIKFQITDRSGQDIEKSHICELAADYVETLPHVEYNALGVNFTMLAIVDNATAFLTERFLKDGDWNKGNDTMQSVGLKFTYELENVSIAFSIERGAQDAIEKPFIASGANFHRNLDINNMPTSKQIKNILDDITSDWEKFNELHSSIIES